MLPTDETDLYSRRSVGVLFEPLTAALALKKRLTNDTYGIVVGKGWRKIESC